MIRIDITTILVTIANKYGKEEFFRKISQLFDIGLMYLKSKDLIIKNTPTKIIIIEDDIIHTIELNEDHYTYTKELNGYKVIRYYDYSKIKMRQSAIFRTSDNELLVIDEIDEENIKNRRIIKTSAEDTDFIKGYFEKEELQYQREDISERYNYIEDNLNHKRVSKQVLMPNNLYVYSYRTIVNAVSRDYISGYIESAACINKPQIIAPGRIREKKELLLLSLKTPTPNILIRGRNAISKDGIEMELYNISIYKIGNRLQLVFKTTHLPQNIQVIEEHTIKSSTFGILTIEDIEQISNFISNNMDITYYNEVKQELINLKNQLLISSKQKHQDIDFIDNRMLMYREFDYLVYDVYTNLAKYEEIISKKINNTGDNPPTLKKTY